MSKTVDEERKQAAHEEATRRTEKVLQQALQLMQMRRNGATQRQAAEVLRLSERTVKYREQTVRVLLSRKGFRRVDE